MSSVRQVVVPADARLLSTLGRIDYEDGFSVDLPEVRERTAEQWARAVIENAPGSFRTSLPRGWRALGLKHGPVDSADHVLGWPIRANTPDMVLLGAESRVGLPGELLIKREPGSLFFATFLRKDNPLARVMWAGVERQHRRVVSYLLDRGTVASARPVSAPLAWARHAAHLSRPSALPALRIMAERDLDQRGRRA